MKANMEPANVPFVSLELRANAVRGAISPELARVVCIRKSAVVTAF
jgi:hypothetical protein